MSFSQGLASAPRRAVWKGDLGHNVDEAEVGGLRLLTDEGGLRMRLQGALQSDVAGGSPHQPHEVVVLFGAEGVDLNVSDGLAEDLRQPHHLLTISFLLSLPSGYYQLTHQLALSFVQAY